MRAFRCAVVEKLLDRYRQYLTPQQQTYTMVSLI